MGRFFCRYNAKDLHFVGTNFSYTLFRQTYADRNGNGMILWCTRILFFAVIIAARTYILLGLISFVQE
jgi:hypothetical protein